MTKSDDETEWAELLVKSQSSSSIERKSAVQLARSKFATAFRESGLRKRAGALLETDKKTSLLAAVRVCFREGWFGDGISRKDFNELRWAIRVRNEVEYDGVLEPENAPRVVRIFERVFWAIRSLGPTVPAINSRAGSVFAIVPDTPAPPYRPLATQPKRPETLEDVLAKVAIELITDERETEKLIRDLNRETEARLQLAMNLERVNQRPSFWDWLAQVGRDIGAYLRSVNPMPGISSWLAQVRRDVAAWVETWW